MLWLLSKCVHDEKLRNLAEMPHIEYVLREN